MKMDFVVENKRLDLERCIPLKCVKITLQTVPS